jgi:YfiH family protein
MKHDWLQPDWPAPPNVRALSTTRSGGRSEGPWSSLNLGMHCGDDPDDVFWNRHKLQEVLPAPPRWLQQVHGSKVVTFAESDSRTEADAIASFEPGQVCAVLTADCLPVLLCSQSGDRVAAVHAGWRGLAAGVLQAAVKALNLPPAGLLAWLGPAIGPAVYEVGNEVATAFPEEFPAGFKRRGDRWLMDLYSLARLKLQGAGVSAIYGGGFCSYSDSERFFSYRRDGETGRMASLVWLA